MRRGGRTGILQRAVGSVRHETFPPTKGAARAIMLVGALLVAGTMFTAVVTA
jgi:hypothetical protein